MSSSFDSFAPKECRIPARRLNVFLAATFVQMALAVLLSGFGALLVQHWQALSDALVGPAGLTAGGWVVVLAPLILVILLGADIERLSGPAACLILFLYAVLTGLSLGTALLGISDAGVFATFGGAAAGFVILAVTGVAMRWDPSAAGRSLSFVLVGLIGAMAVNLLVRSTALDLGLSAIGILLFGALIAIDTNRLKRLYRDHAPEAGDAIAVLGALTLYLDFLNLFLSLLRFTGRRR